MTATLTWTSADLRHADDGRLLADFVQHRRQEAFAELVRRHGPMVLAVCRSVLGEAQTAEDAAQSVFLTLAQKASGLQTQKTIVGWLHRISWYVAARAATAAAIRRRHEQESARMSPTESSEFDHVPGDELHAALRSLPGKYRLALLLHHMEGRTEQETAALLGCSPSAASMRLSRGRDMLRERLLKRGIKVSAAVLAGILTKNAGAAVPSAFVTSTATLATSALAGQTRGHRDGGGVIERSHAHAESITNESRGRVFGIVGDDLRPGRVCRNFHGRRTGRCATSHRTPHNRDGA